MVPPTAYRFLSATLPRSGAVAAQYGRVDDDAATSPRVSREPLEEYPYLRSLSLGWLDRHDEPALDGVDDFLRSHGDEVDAERAGHDLSVYLCNWVVVNVDAAYWVLDPAGTCYVQLGAGWLDPYRFAVQCITDRQPVARRFVLRAWRLEPPGSL